MTTGFFCAQITFYSRLNWVEHYFHGIFVWNTRIQFNIVLPIYSIELIILLVHRITIVHMTLLLLQLLSCLLHFKLLYCTCTYFSWKGCVYCHSTNISFKLSCILVEFAIAVSKAQKFKKVQAKKLVKWNENQFHGIWIELYLFDYNYIWFFKNDLLVTWYF